MAQAATKTAIVTGAAGGVARALLPMLIGDGYRVALIDVNAIGLGKIAAEHGDKVVALPCDLTDLPALTAALEKARVTFRTLDLLINNAGVATTGPFVDIDPASIPRDIGINLVAPLHIIHTVAPWMRSPGAIVNTISMASITPLAGSSVYSATKFALRGFNIALHMLMKPCGITVSGVLPGAIDTPMLLKATREGATALNFLRSAAAREGGEGDPARREGRQGRILHPLQRAHPVQLRAALSSAHPDHLSLVRKMGVKRQKAYLASRAKDTLPEGTPIPERERAEAL
jgi:2-dehydro-3-deoxy-L-rhamnonate dehydrogenase (NAD+)